MFNIRTVLQTEFSVSDLDFEKALAFQKKFSGRLEHILINIGALSEDALPRFYSSLLGIEVAEQVSLGEWQPNDEDERDIVLNLSKFDWFVIDKKAENFRVISLDPLSPEANQYINQNALKITLSVGSETQIQDLRNSFSGTEDKASSIEELSDIEEDRLRELALEAPTVNLLNGLISRALKARASDMHLEPVEGRYRVRYRIDGVLQEIETIPSRMRLPLASRLKILAGMDIAEKRRPQDGKIGMRISNEDLDIRVSALPLSDGESIVMRFLRQDSINYDMAVLGLSADIEAFIKEDIKRTSGVILLTGPTGSGKTTSLYTFLNAINDSSNKIITLEDPVEYRLPGINQVQVQPNIGFDFGAGLRSIVRQDPDIIMIGEIRDAETAKIAMQSALTGHLVFSTVHTNDAPSAYTRLLDLGVEEFLLNAALVSIVAQRLVRKLCPSCSHKRDDVKDLVKQYDLQALADKNNVQLNVCSSAGCEQCSNTGYKGRLAIVEYLRCDEEINIIEKNEVFTSKAREVNKLRGGRTLLEDGLLKVILGQTTIDEVMRVAG
jgi:general secretion pathway protein E